MKKITYLIGFLLIATISFAQQTIKGVVTDADTKQVLPDVIVRIEGSKASARTDEKGFFRLLKVPKGKKTLTFILKDHKSISQEVVSNEAIVRLGSIVMGKPDAIATENIPIITLEDANTTDEATDDQNVSSQLGITRDLFVKYTRFPWGAARYRTRGYLNNYTESYFNGVPFNDLNDERAPFNEYSGLNDVTRLNQSYQGLASNTFAFGDLAGSSNIDTRASLQRKQTRISYMNTNRAYRHRIMGTYSTGLMSNGWAVSVSASHRWAQEGYIPGTFMDASAYFLSVDKVINDKATVNLTVFDSPTTQGGAGNTIAEMIELSGSNYYNHSWGYQGGKKRNSSITKRQAPTAILRYDLKLNEHATLITAASFQAENNSRSGIDWYNARDPRPDYYSTIPSGFDDEKQKAEGRALYMSGDAPRQIDWDYMYQTNYNSKQTVNGTTGNRAKYFLADNVTKSKEANIYSNYQNALSDNFQISGGLAYRYYQGEDFRRMNDLLGADYSVDVDRFAERANLGSAFAQNDTRTPNRILKVGDKFGYDYKTTVNNAYAWGQGNWSYNHFDFFLAGKGSTTSFFREGLTKNGRFPDNSLGKSDIKSFINYGVKGGITYKLDGRNYFNVYAGYTTKAPNSRDAFLSPRTRNSLVDSLRNEKILSGEAAYKYTSPKFSAQITGYYTLFQNKVKAFSFYSDEDQSFVNYVAQGLDTRHAGIEAVVDFKEVFPKLDLYAAGTMSQSLYWSRPTATATPDNGVTSIQSNLDGQTIYIKGYYVANTPQNAATVGLRYQAPHRWTLNANANYFGQRWMDINFNRRTNYAVGQQIGTKEVVYDSKQWHDIIDQQKLPDVFTVNASASWNHRFKGKYFFTLTLSVDNVLDNQFISTASEQWRFDAVNKDINKFPPRYYYAFGRNYFVQTAISF